MGIRKTPLVNGNLYHIYTRSIAEYTVFKNREDFVRMEELMKYYKFKQDVRFCEKDNIKNVKEFIKPELLIIEIVAYCLMPTHIHFILYQIQDLGISSFMERVLKSYSLYFNNKYKRKGPLWDGRFKNVLIRTDEQLLHLTRYIHLNPVTSYLVEKPENWEFSSYREYLEVKKEKICKWDEFFKMKVEDYKNFVEERKDYQRELAKIKNLLLE